MNDKKKFLEGIRDGSMSIQEGIKELEALSFVDLGFARVDIHRRLRKGFPEVIWSEGKSAEQIIAIINEMMSQGQDVLATRLDEEKAAVIVERFQDARYDPTSRTLTLTKKALTRRGKGLILVITAGTSDIPVAEEAVVTARMMGSRVEKLYDVGVAGLHRLFSGKDIILKARVIVVVAGMEGALASVVGGLVKAPVIAVPTSVGYGVSLHGLSALLAMLTSCAPGVAVVNIDNGFGAGYLAGMINSIKR